MVATTLISNNYRTVQVKGGIITGGGRCQITTMKASVPFAVPPPSFDKEMMSVTTSITTLLSAGS